MTTLSLDKRPCKIGITFSTRREKHGEEKIPAKDIKLSNILLTKDELNDFLEDDDAWDMLYVETKGKPAEPLLLDRIAPLHVIGKYVECQATLSFGLKPYSVDFSDAKFKSLTLDRQTGGLTALSLMVQCLKSNISGDVSLVDDYLDDTADISLEFGPLSNGEEEEAEENPELDLTPNGELGFPVPPKSLGGNIKREKIDHRTRKSEPAIT